MLTCLLLLSDNIQSHNMNFFLNRRKQRKKNKNPDDAASIDDIFLPKDDTELELGDLDEFERELETFKVWIETIGAGMEVLLSLTL